MNRTLKPFVAAAATAAIAVLAAGRGGSAYSPGAYGSPAKTSAPSTVGVAGVGVANTKLGRIVVDRSGRTLYLFERDKNRRSACNGACAQAAAAQPRQARRSLHADAVATRNVSAHRRQRAGHVRRSPALPLHADTKPGQTNGEGLEEFGGGCDVLSPAGKKIEADS